MHVTISPVSCNTIPGLFCASTRRYSTPNGERRAPTWGKNLSITWQEKKIKEQKKKKEKEVSTSCCFHSVVCHLSSIFSSSPRCLYTSGAYLEDTQREPLMQKSCMNNESSIIILGCSAHSHSHVLKFAYLFWRCFYIWWIEQNNIHCPC